MTDDQILMGAVPASREYVLPTEDKVYKGVPIPADMSRDQEKNYRAAIDEREKGFSQREIDRGASDRAETTEDAAEILSVAAGAVPTIPTQLAAAGADAYIAGRDIGRGDYGAAAISGAAMVVPFVSAGMLKAAMEGGTKAAREAFKKIDDINMDLQGGIIDEARVLEAKKLGDAITQEFNAATAGSDFPAYTGRSADFMRVSDSLSPGDELAEQMMNEKFMTIAKVGDTPEDLIRRQQPMSRREELAMEANRGDTPTALTERQINKARNDR